jgi:hypothetical protein
MVDFYLLHGCLIFINFKTMIFLYIFLFFFIIGGESFKISGFNISLFFFLLFSLTNSLKIFQNIFSKNNFVFNLFFFIFSIYSITKGVLEGYKSAYIVEDYFPFAVLFIFINFFQSLSLKKFISLTRFITILTSLLVFKVLLLNFLPIEPIWGGDTFWQASKSIVFPNFHRIILKGGEFFNLFVFNLLAASLIFKISLFKNKKLLYLLLFFNFLILFFSLTRTSFLVSIVVIFIVFIFRIKNESFYTRFKSFISLSIVSVFIFSLFNSSVFQERNNKDEGGDLAIGWRQLESIIALDKASEFNYLGNGMGASFEMTYASGNFKEDGQDLYVHNYFVWFILKAGYLFLILGIVIIFFLLFRKINFDNNNYYLFFSLKIILIVFLLINEFVNNKMSGFSGAFLYSYLFSFIMISSKTLFHNKISLSS